MKFLFTRIIPVLAIIAIGVAGYVYLTRPNMGANPVVANGSTSTTVMEFSTLSSIDDLPSGWWHRKFWTKPAMELSLVDHQGTRALRCETNGGGSIFGRNTDIALADLSILTWDWFVEVPIISDTDEATREGDDHPARLFIAFEDGDAKAHHVEIIWSNQRYAPGDYKYIGEFPHYVANGLNENIGQWHSQSVDLAQIYQDITKRPDSGRLKLISVFCDSDDTGTHSVAYFSDVTLSAR